jgi:DNA ligase-1
MAQFELLAQLAEEMAATSSRLKKRAAIAEAIAAVHGATPSTGDAGLFALYLSGTPFAESDPRKLNAGGALLSKALLAVSGASDAVLTAAYRRHGDLGAAAFDLLQDREKGSGNRDQQEPLTLRDVAEAFAGMAAARTTAARATLVENLLRRATALEAKYLLKLMLGDMRIGVKQSLVEEAIAVAASTPEAAVTPTQVRHAVMLEADLVGAVQRAFAGTLADARMRLFHPLGFMLASPVDSPEDAIARFTAADEPAPDDLQPATIHAFLEDKYDGMRAQLHCGDPAQPGRVALYSRNRDDVTESFPELSEAFAHVDPSANGPLILDGEILGWDYGSSGDEPHALPFAILGQRIGRKRVTNETRTAIPVIFMAFDVLYAGGALTLNLPLRERRNRLEAIAEQLIPRTVAPLEIDPHANSAQFQLFNATGNLQLPCPASCSLLPAWSKAQRTSIAPSWPPALAATKAS